MTERCGEKSLVIYINIININNDSLWYYPSWLLFSLNVIFAKVLLFTCCCGFPLSTIFISIVNLFFFLYRSTFRTLFPAALKFNTWRVTFFSSCRHFYLHFFIVFLLFALFVWYGTLWFHMHFFFCKHQAASLFLFILIHIWLPLFPTFLYLWQICEHVYSRDILYVSV